MPHFGAIRRAELIQYLKKLKFQGPFSGGKHQYMVKEKLRIFVLLAKILKQAGISKDEWERL